jgi:phage terminase Nu1 subunit (DNA packaging protein)
MAKAKKAPPKPHWAKSHPELHVAALLGVETATVRKYVAAGMPRNEDGSYDLLEVVKWWKQWLFRHGGGAQGDAFRETEKYRRANLEQQARMRRIKADKEEGKYLPRDEVRSAHNDLVAMIKSRLEELVPSITSAVPPEVAERCREVAQECVDQTEKELSMAGIV